MGRLQVWVPEFGSIEDDANSWITVNYCSPFAGATNNATASRTNFDKFDSTQTSYGMWMVPPDINSQVIIMFIGGDPARGIWIGSMYNQYMNNMVPGIPANLNTATYPDKAVPAAEYNKWNKSVTHPDKTIKPVEDTKFKGVGNQGLITDPSRGTTTSGARRESPSAVFGILTPGPVIEGTDKTPETVRRKGGSSFVMDDGTGSEHITLATKSGAQVKIDETNGFVYLINRDGTAWIQMDKDGNVDIFGAQNISMRAQRDFNIRADRNVNIEAGQNVFIKAAKDTKEEKVGFTFDINNLPKPSSVPVWNFKGEGNGDGGNIVMQALNNWHSTTQNTAFLTVRDNNMNIAIGNSFALTTITGTQDYASKLGIKLATEASCDLAVTGDIRVSSASKISVISNSDLVFCTNASLSTKATNNINAVAGNNILSQCNEFGITAAVKMSNTLDVMNTISSTATAQLNAGSANQAPSGPPLAFPAGTPMAPVHIQSDPALIADPSQFAEIKPMNNKTNILASWADPVPKFKRNAQAFQTITTRLATYEPCPEHENFSTVSVSGGIDELSQADKTYQGSSGAGNSPPASPAPKSTVAGADNKEVQADPVSDNSFSRDINNAALKCQLLYHEGKENTVYLDSVGKPTAGIGHFLREDELAKYPIGTPISDSQIDAWYEQDATTANKIARKLSGDTWGSMSDVRRRAMVDLAFNLGELRLSKFTKFICSMEVKNYNNAAIELKNSKWFGQVKRRGPNILSMIAHDVDPTGCDKKFPG
jgi:lysozyme